MPTQRFEARPTLEKTGNVSWELCHMNPSPPTSPPKCGDSKATYPDVFLVRNTGKHKFEFNITQDQTGLEIKFANDPLWIEQGAQPTQAVVDSQIENIKGKGTSELKFDDKNSKPDPGDPAPVVLKYQLNFVDKNNNKVTEIDPEITNGGTDTVDGNQTALLLAGIALLMLMGAIWLGVVARRRAARSGPAQDDKTSAAEQQSDVTNNRDGGV